MSRESALSAIESGDLSKLQHVLEKSQWDIGSEPLDSKGQTALHIACANGHLDIAKYLVNEKKCSVAVEDVYGHTPLMLSLINKHWIVADFLVKSVPSSDINETLSSYTKSLVARGANEALVESCKNDYFELVKYLTGELDLRVSEEYIQLACDNGHWKMLLYLKWKRGDSGFADIGPPHLTPLHDNVKVALKGELWEAAKVLLMLVQQRSSHMSLGLSSKGLKQLMKVVAIGNLNSACSHGYLQVVEYYHRVGILSSEQLSGAPLETARSSGHLHIVHYLLKHCKCTVPDDMSEIRVACSLGDVEKVKTALDRYGSAILSTTDRYGTAAIHYAAYEPAVLSMIVIYDEVNERGILLSTQDSEGNIPLHHCIMSQCDESVNLLIAFHLCDVNHLNLQGEAFFHTACEQSNISALQLLVADERCNINIPDSNGDTALHIAVSSESNSVQMVQCLLQSGRCDINLTNSLHYTPLHVACKQGSIKVVEKLVEDERCDLHIPDSAGDTALHIAVCSESNGVQMVQCLLQNGRCDINLTNRLPSAPLHVACKQGSIEVVEKLVADERCDPYIQDANGDTALYAAVYSEIDKDEKVQFLLNRQPINTDTSCTTELSIIIDSVLLSGIKCLLKLHNIMVRIVERKKAIFFDTTLTRRTPLNVIVALIHHVANCNSMTSMHLEDPTSFQHKASITAQIYSHKERLQTKANHNQNLMFKFKGINGSFQYNSQQETLLHAACRGGYCDMTVTLLNSGADVQAVDSYGNAAIHIACKNVRFDCFKVLLSCGRCDPNQKNTGGDTVLHIVCRMTEIIDVVLRISEAGDLNNIQCILETLVADERCDLNILDRNGDTALHKGVDNALIVKCLLESGRSRCDIFNREGSTPFHKAIATANMASIECFLKNGADILQSTNNKLQNAPIHIACKHVRLDVLKILLGCKSCDPNQQNAKGDTALHIVCRNTVTIGTKLRYLHVLMSTPGINPAIVNHEGLAPFEVVSDGRTLLHSACAEGNSAMVRFLVKNGADILRPDRSGDAPIHIACKYSNSRLGILKVLAYVSCNNCDPNQQNAEGDTALHIVCRKTVTIDTKLRYLHVLVSTPGINPTIVNHEGLTPFEIVDSDGRTLLHSACAEGNFAMVELLVKNGADILRPDRDGDAPIHIACKHFRPDVLEKVLGCKSCDPNQQNAEGDTALHIVCRTEMTIDITLQYLHLLTSTPGINPAIGNHEGLTPFEIVDSDGRTRLHSACAEGNSAMVELLVKNGADILRPDRDGDAPIHIACKLTYGGRLDILKVLVGCNHCDPNQQNADGDTALHIVCRIKSGNKLQFIQVLISTPGINPEIVNHAGLTPIELAGTNYSVIDTIRTFLENKNSSIQAYLKIFVIGNSGTGKSTLIKAVTTEASRWLKYSPFSRAKYVNPDDVPPHTAGIIPIPFNSNHFGSAVLYDFAGQHEYYSSHAAVMENLILPSPPLFLLLIDISKPMQEIRDELVYWWHFINNQSQRAAIPPHVILGGSHKDVVKSRGEDELGKLEMIKDCIKDIPVIFQFVDYFPLDCRKLVSRGLSALLTQFKATCQFLRQGVDVNLHCHILKAFLTTPEFRNLVYCEVASVMERIESDNAPLPRSYNQLIPLFASLNDQGHILLIQNHTDESKSWVILKPEELLAHVNGSIFAPDYFKEYFHHFAMSTGVVTLSKVKEQFAKHSHEVIVKYLIHLEFCFQLKDRHTLNMITNNEVHTSLSTETTEYQEKYYFFPSLVRVENPTDVCQQQETISFECGWLYMCSNVTEQFTTRFLHVLILRLVFACEHPDDLTAMESVVLLRRCSVWKRGIAWWTNDGIETIVEVGLQCRWVAVMMRCPDSEKVQCTELRSKVIRTVLKAKKDFCPAITMKEFLIAPSSLQYPFEGRKLTLYSMREIAKVVIEGKKYATDTEGKNAISIPKLLPFEPYHNMRELITKFFSGDTSLAVTPEDLTRLAEKCHDKLAELKTAFKPDISSFQRDCVKADCTEVERCVALFHILQRRGFKTWKDFEQEFSRFSIFCGHNPMEMAGRQSESDTPLETLSFPSASDGETVPQSPNQETPHISGYDAHDQVVREKAGSRPSNKDLANQVIPKVCPMWREIGCQLNLDVSLLNEIDSNCRGLVRECCTRVFDEWLKQDTRASWSRVLSACRIVKENLSLCPQEPHTKNHIKALSQLLATTLPDFLGSL